MSSTLAPAAPALLPIAEESLVYKRTPQGELHLEMVRPRDAQPGEQRACMVFFHGGGWRRGSTQQFLPFARALAYRGMVALSAEFRVLEEGEQALPLRAIEDARSALRWVRAHAAQLGVDPQRIGAGGGSSGGHLALMTAMTCPFDDPADDLAVSARPDALVVMNAPLDFDDFASPLPREERRRCAPLHLLDDTLPPALLMHGTDDRVVPFVQLLDFQERARVLGLTRLKTIPFEGRGHGFFNKGKGQPGDFLLAAKEMRMFLGSLGWI